MHHAAWVIAPLVVAGTLGLSAATKVGKGDSLRSVIANLRLPSWVLPRWLARAIPGIEVVVAIGLVAPWVPVFAAAALAALSLMVIYWSLIARGLTITPRPTCGCFGAVDQPISRRTLLRNTLLVAAAGAAVTLAASGRTVWSLLSDAGSGDWVWLALAVLACVVAVLVFGTAGAPATPGTGSTGAAPQPAHRHASPGDDTAASVPTDEDDDDYIRVPTPELLLHDPEAGPVTLIELSAKRAQLLVFVNCYCASTSEAIADLEGWQDRLAVVDVRIVFSVPILERLTPVTPPGTLVDHRGLTWRALGLTGSPSAVLLGVDGYLAGGPVDGTADVRTFVGDVADALSEAPTPEAETPSVEETAHR